jgi:hypothetical protein
MRLFIPAIYTIKNKYTKFEACLIFTIGAAKVSACEMCSEEVRRVKFPPKMG